MTMMMMMMMMIHVPRCQKVCKTGPVCKTRKASRSISHEGDAHPISQSLLGFMLRAFQSVWTTPLKQEKQLGR